MEFTREHVNKNGREIRYGWISRKYSTALSCLAGNDVEIVDEFGPFSEPISFEGEGILNMDDIVQIHDQMIDDFGGEYGIRDEGLLTSLSVAPYSEFFGEEQYPGILQKAAKYLFDFTNYQVFIDGNKRTGLAVLNAYLAANGLTLTMSVSDAYQLVMAIAKHEYKDSKDIVPVLQMNIETIK